MALSDLLRGRAVDLYLTNKSGGALAVGDVVVIDTANDEAFTTTTTGQAEVSVGVLQESVANDAAGRVRVQGYCPTINVNGTVTRGHYLETHTVVGDAVGNATRRAGSFGQALTGASGSVSGVLWGQADQTASGSGSVATDAIWDAKGDLAVGTGANTASRLAVGANGTIPIADSAEATGIRWGREAGRLLGSTNYEAGSDATLGTVSSATVTDFDATNALVTFDGTGWDNILVRVSVMWRHNTAAKWFYAALRESTTTVKSRKFKYHDNANGLVFQRIEVTFYVTGVTDGSHTYKWAGAVDTTSAATCYTGTTNGPLIMEVWGVS